MPFWSGFAPSGARSGTVAFPVSSSGLTLTKASVQELALQEPGEVPMNLRPGYMPAMCSASRPAQSKKMAQMEEKKL